MSEIEQEMEQDVSSNGDMAVAAFVEGHGDVENREDSREISIYDGRARFLDGQLILSPEITIEEYMSLPRFLDYTSKNSPWWVGDFVVGGEAVHPQMYAQALEEFPTLTMDTIRSYASVSRKVPPPRRNNALEFGHHRAVMALKAGDQRRWLKLAAESRWSVAELIKRIKGEDGDRKPSKSELLREAERMLWITSTRGPATADTNQYVVSAEWVEQIAKLNGDMPDDADEDDTETFE